jgi:hypothetical protein
LSTKLFKYLRPWWNMEQIFGIVLLLYIRVTTACWSLSIRPIWQNGQQAMFMQRVHPTSCFNTIYERIGRYCVSSLSTRFWNFGISTMGWGTCLNIPFIK